MARLQNTITGRMSGSIGSIRFSTWKGINVGASKPSSVANPRSNGQVTQRNKMKGLVAAFRASSDGFDIGFMQQAVKKSAYNAFVSSNMQSGYVIGSPTDFTFDGSLLVAAKGTLTPTPILTAVKSEGSRTITLTWSTTATGDQLSTDNLCEVICDATGLPLIGGIAIPTRATGTATFTLAVGTDMTQEFFVYTFFYQASSRKVSNSVLSVVAA